MLFSVPTGKSESGWLDRLRTSKGFPQNDASDLENFLQTPNSSIPGRADSSPNSRRILESTHNDDRKIYNAMSNVLNELFNFGDNCSNSTNFKKSARKQANPRICAFSSNVSNENNNVALGKARGSRSGDSNSGVEGVKALDKREEDGEGNEKDMNLSGFSRIEVTVIDTSYGSWKFEKLLYRKKNVWKVRDKKGKSEIVGSKKKRKTNVSVENYQLEEKKQKHGEQQGFGEECHAQLNEIRLDNNLLKAHEKASGRTSKPLKKKQANLELENGNSSVILIKSIPPTKKPGIFISKNVLKAKQSKS